MITLSLQHSTDHTSGGIMPEEAVNTYNDFAQGYIVTLNDLIFPSDKTYDAFVKKLKNNYKIKIYDYSSNNPKKDECRLTKIFCDKFKLYINTTIDEERFCTLCTKTEDEAFFIWKLYTECTKNAYGAVEFSFYKYVYSQDGGIDYDIKPIVDYKKVLNISKSYYPYIKTDLLFSQFFTGKESILLLVGESGLGKSKFASLALRYMIENYKKLLKDKLEKYRTNIPIAQVKNIKVLANEEFWRKIANVEPALVIIDDLDFMLTSRDSEILSEDDICRNAFLNNFLSFTDGITENKVKFIITTNQKFKDIDQALLRKGRLFDILELRKLKNDEALSIWKENNLPKSKFKFKGDVLASDLGSEIEKYSNSIIKEDALKMYLNEKNISKLVLNRTKKIGL